MLLMFLDHTFNSLVGGGDVYVCTCMCARVWGFCLSAGVGVGSRCGEGAGSEVGFLADLGESVPG